MEYVKIYLTKQEMRDLGIEEKTLGYSFTRELVKVAEFLLDSLNDGEGVKLPEVSNKRGKGKRVVNIELGDGELRLFEELASKVNMEVGELVKALLVGMVEEKENVETGEIEKIEVVLPHEVVQLLVNMDWREEIKDFILHASEDDWKKVKLQKIENRNNKFIFTIDKGLLEKLKEEASKVGCKWHTCLERLLVYLTV